MSEAEQLIEIAKDAGADVQQFHDGEFIDATFTNLNSFEEFAARIRAEALQDAAAYVLANAKIKNSCCAETRASIYKLIKGMGND
jgi:hypothetical protein